MTASMSHKTILFTKSKADYDYVMQIWILPLVWTLSLRLINQWRNGSQRPRQLYKSPRYHKELMRVEENEQRAGDFVYSGNSTTAAGQLSKTHSKLLLGFDLSSDTQIRSSSVKTLAGPSALRSRRGESGFVLLVCSFDCLIHAALSPGLSWMWWRNNSNKN